MAFANSTIWNRSTATAFVAAVVFVATGCSDDATPGAGPTTNIDAGDAGDGGFVADAGTLADAGPDAGAGADAGTDNGKEVVP